MKGSGHITRFAYTDPFQRPLKCQVSGIVSSPYFRDGFAYVRDLLWCRKLEGPPYTYCSLSLAQMPNIPKRQTEKVH